MSKDKLINKLRCLRMHLSPLLKPEDLETLEEAERRLKCPGGVSTVPVAPSTKKRQFKASVNRNTIYNKYFHAKA